MADTLPPFYFYFFWLVEPIMTLAGGVYAIFLPEHYALDLIPNDVERFTSVLGNTIRGKMALGGLGSCFALLGMISFSLFPIFKYRAPVALQERLVAGLLVPLAIGDLVHIAVTLIPLPADVRVQPWRWTQLIHGNVVITAFLFVIRLAWLTGVGRFSVPNGTIVETELFIGDESSASASGPSDAPTPRRRGRPRKHPVEKTE